MMAVWFPTTRGVRQGDVLSPTLFSLFVNDLALEVKHLNRGLPVGQDKLSILLYADDIVLLVENEHDLQEKIDCLHAWCRKWRLCINTAKTNIISTSK